MADIIEFPSQDDDEHGPVTFTIQITQYTPERAEYVMTDAADDPENPMRIADLLEYMVEAIRMQHCH